MCRFRRTGEASLVIDAGTASLLSPLEIAAGLPLPAREKRRPLERSRLDPLTALQQIMLSALQRPPCVVSFSGGRDSSLVLAAAVDLARRHALPLPVPVTVRVLGDVQQEEHGWQETVIRHLGLSEWLRIDIDDELDCIGPVAQRILLRHGVLWPANAHFHVPQFEHAAGGTLLTGMGGDEIFSSSRWTDTRRALSGKERPRLRHGRQLAAIVAPRAVRARVYAARTQIELEWLRPLALSEIVDGLMEQAAAEPFGWRSRFEWLLGLRYLTLAQQSLAVIASDWDVEIRHPLLAPGFASALASLPRERRFADRSQALTELFGDLLPKGLATRTSKAVFAGTLWGETSRAFAAGWEGAGVDHDVVDVDALRRRWRAEETGEGPYSLLQSLWLQQHGGQASASTARSSSTDRGMASQERDRRSSQAGSALS
jgi:asparagine synthase (glutamine-hydrolysing)